MAIFKKTKEAKEEKKAVKADTSVAKKDTKQTVVLAKDLSWVLRSPRITEKSALSAEKNVYVFNIATKATKSDVKGAIEELYKVKPVKISTAKIPSKIVTRRKRGGVTTGKKIEGKKAYVYLKKGDVIEFA
jgi:large subunit ribosomal protein L23